MKINNLSIHTMRLAVPLAAGWMTLTSATVWAAESGIRHITFSQDAKQILYLDERQAPPTIHVMDATTGQETSVTTLPIDPRQQMPMGFTPDGFKLALLESKGLSILHNKTGKTLRTLPVPGLPSSLIQYRPAQAITNASGTQQLFQDTAQAKLNVVHTGSGKLLETITLPAGRLQAMGMSADGRKVAYLMPDASGRGELSMYDLYQHKVTQTVAVPVAGNAPLSTPVVFSPDGRYAAWLPWLIDLSAGSSNRLASAGVGEQAIFSSHSRTLWFSQKNQLIAHDLQSGSQQAIPLELPASCRAASTHDFDPAGRWLVLGHQCADGKAHISVLDGSSGRLTHNFKP